MILLLILAVVFVPINPLVSIALIVSLLITSIFLVAQSLFWLVKKVRQKLTQAVRGASLPRSISTSLRDSYRYGELIVQTAQQYPPGPLRDRLNLTLKPVNEWLTNLARLEKGLAKLYSQRNPGRELRRTSFEIDNLRRRLLTATGREANYLRELKKSKEMHLATLQELQQFQSQAELKICKIASDLGATHAEMLLIIAKGDFNENRIRRLDENLQEHLSGMKDMLTAMDEMGYSSAATG
jgi:hypothetical protein